MSADTLRLLSSLCVQKNITPLYENPEPIYLCFVDLAQWAQLERDQEFMDGMQNWPKGLDQSNVLFQNAAAYFAGMIVVRAPRVAMPIYSYYSSGTYTLTSIAGTYQNADKISYGPVDTSVATELNGRDPSVLYSASETTDKHKLKMGVVMGAQALLGIEKRIPKFTTDEWDHRNKRELAVDCFDGYCRPDFDDDPSPASATTSKNYGSMPFVTYSPLEAPAV